MRGGLRLLSRALYTAHAGTTVRRLTPQPMAPLLAMTVRHAGLKEDDVRGRILNILKDFKAIADSSKINPEAHFVKDLGLDSLDAVEIVMAVEDEFEIEIPDEDVEKITTAEQATQYVLNKRPPQ